MSEQLERVEQGLAGRYAVERELGSGGMATVYLAEDLERHRKVAVKVLKPELAAAIGPDRFLREIEVTANLDHPHILPLFDSGEADGFLYYVMPYVEGESLRDKLDREKQLSVVDATEITREVATALGYAHDRGVIHRDIKPENILLSGGMARLADFGIAKAVTEEARTALTETGLVVGSAHYMSPEQAAGEKELDGRSDLYALGCVLYEMLSGRPPFTGPTVDDVVRQHLTIEPQTITDLRPKLPMSVTVALEKCLTKTRADRFATANDLHAALRVSQPASTATSRVAGSKRLVFAGIALAAFIGLYLAFGTRRPPDETQPPLIEAAAGVAVLPFRVSPGLELWREGMVDVLSTKLDGVGGLRGIHSGTVMVRWREEVGKDVDADLLTMLRIAERTGARWMVVGGVISSGAQMRLTARVYDVQDDAEVGSVAEVEGSPDSVLTLSDQLTVAIVQRLWGSEGLAAARVEDASTLLTPSVDALRAYLEGEALARRRELDGARAAYERALRADTAFALAYIRLAETRGFGGDDDVELAYRYIDRVSQREALKIRGMGGVIQGNVDHLEALRTGARQYPDDAELWRILGEAYIHSEGEAMVPLEEMTLAFERAVALRPDFVFSYEHLVDGPINLGDSARAFRGLEAWTSVQTRSPRGYEVAAQLVFGDSALVNAVRSELPNLATQALGSSAWWSLWAPHTLDARETIARELRTRPPVDDWRAFQLCFVLINRGKYKDALAQLEDPLFTGGWRAWALYLMHLSGFPLPPERLGRELTLDLTRPSRGGFFAAGAYAAERERWQALDSVITAARARAVELLAAANTTGARRFEGIAEALVGYRAWKEGRYDDAVEEFTNARAKSIATPIGTTAFIRIWMADLYEERGELWEAIRYLESLWGYGWDLSVRYYRLGALYERIGDVDKARAAYENFLVAWAEADEDLPQLAEAREAVGRLAAMRN